MENNKKPERNAPIIYLSNFLTFFCTVLCFYFPCSASREDALHGQLCMQGKAGQRWPGRSIPAVHQAEKPLPWKEEAYAWVQH